MTTIRNTQTRTYAVRRLGAAFTLGLLSLLATTAPHADAQTFSTVYSFGAFPGDGAEPLAPLVQDSAGNLYGTTRNGGSLGTGTVYKLDGHNLVTVVHSFNLPTEGGFPEAGLALDNAGNLYGITADPLGELFPITVFKLDTSYQLTVLHTLPPELAFAPVGAGLLLDGNGNLYGTTEGNGNSGIGMVFTLDTHGNNYTVLHSFNVAEGAALPYGGVIRDAAGNLYGTTAYGGAGVGQRGTVFKLDTSGNFTVLHSFAVTTDDGFSPSAALLLGADGYLYGTTYFGGASGFGTVFKLDPSGNNYAVLHSFTGTDGSRPSASVIQDSAGDLYGTTQFGGAGYGTLFKLGSSGDSFTVLHSFTGTDGSSVAAGPMLDFNGNLYGTTTFGGTNGVGTIYKYTLTTPFSSFTPKLSIVKGPPPGYQFNATVTQQAGAPAITPLTQGVTLHIGAFYTLTIPGSAFAQTKKGYYVYQTPSLQVRIAQTGATSWQVQIEATGVDLTTLTHPAVTLTLGKNSSTTTQ